jgi:hypothetical protein
MKPNGRSTLHFHGALTGLVREEELQGRAHLVAPVVLVKSMVLGEGPGAELLPGEEIVNSAERWLWEGRPVTIDHPMLNGQWASAGLLQAAEDSQIGTLRNVKADQQNMAVRLLGEAWIDVQLAQRLEKGVEVMNRLSQFKEASVPPGTRPIEVSTGYWAELEQKGGVMNGRQYHGIERNIVPDHLAVLPDGIGKCSLADGCGLPRLNSDAEPTLPVRLSLNGEDVRANVLSSARTPTFSKTSSGQWSKPALADFISAKGWDASGWGDLTDTQKRSVVATTLLGQVEDTFAASMVFPVVGADGTLYENALRAVLGGRGSQANIPAAALESARAKARSLLSSEFDVQLEGNASLGQRLLEKVAKVLHIELAPFQPRASQSDSDLRRALDALLEEQFGGQNVMIWVEDVFQQDGYVVFEREEGGGPSGLFRVDFSVDVNGSPVLSGQAVEVRKQTTYEPVGNAAGGADAEGDDDPNDEDGTMKDLSLNDTQRTAIVAALVACAACSYSEQTLNALTDSDLVAIAANREMEVEGVDLKALAAPEADTAGEAGTGGGEAGTAPASGEGAAAAAGEGGAPAPAANAEDEVIPLEKLPPEIRAMVAEKRQSRSELIAALVANEACGLEKAELEMMADSALEKLQAAFTRRDFSARGGPRSRANSGDGESYIDRHPRTPSVVTRKVVKQDA